DGLAADLGHILEQSAVGAELRLEALPCPPDLADMAAQQRQDLQLAGGDDYELCFTIPAAERGRLAAIEAELGIALTVIGVITDGVGLVLREADGTRRQLKRAGYEHFTGAGPGDG
ncbi:MAG: thiamine-phosphate kinase, partial [Xanthomonadales bacterium]|nr:thiamine-phosphate kinase [Xanthomonadales bacterium]